MLECLRFGPARAPWILCECPFGLARACKGMQGFARACKGLQGLEKVCAGLQGFAKVWQGRARAGLSLIHI
eukprot:9129612-Alexandrium_andersonii.AAC.1